MPRSPPHAGQSSAEQHPAGARRVDAGARSRVDQADVGDRTHGAGQGRRARAGSAWARARRRRRGATVSIAGERRPSGLTVASAPWTWDVSASGPGSSTSSRRRGPARWRPSSTSWATGRCGCPRPSGREAITHAAVLLDATERMVVATGVANIYNRLPNVAAMASACWPTTRAGGSCSGSASATRPMVEGMLSQSWDKPYCRMRSYLDGLDDAVHRLAGPARGPAPGAGRPRARGCWSWPPPAAWGRSHVLRAGRAHRRSPGSSSGDGPMLLVEQAAVLSTDAEVARDAARKHMAMYLTLPNYVNNLRRLGWGDDDLAGGGSDKLVDALVAWGDADGDRGPGRRARRRRAPTTCACRCSTPTSPPCRSTSGARWRPRCWRADAECDCGDTPAVANLTRGSQVARGAPRVR